MGMCGLFLGLPSASGHLYAVGLSRLVEAEGRHVLLTLLEGLRCHFIVVKQRRCIGEGLRPQDMRVLVALTVDSWYKMLKGTAVQRQGCGPFPLLVLLNGLNDEVLLKRGNCRHWMQIAATLHCLCMHADSCVKAHVGQAWAQTFNHMCSVTHTTHYSWSSKPETCMPAHSPLVSDSLTAFTRLSALGMCSKSTNGWVKNSAKVIRASGFLSSSRNRRSLQSLDTLAPGGSWCTKHDLIMLHSIRTIRGKRTADCCQGFLLLHHYFFIKGWP